MTKKDYTEIAKIINARISNCEKIMSGTVSATDEARRSAPNEYYAIESIANELADLMQRDNPAFNHEKFLQACGLA